MNQLQEFKEEFSSREGIHFNNAGRTPLSRSVSQRLVDFVHANQVHGALADHQLIEGLIAARQSLAEFLGTEKENVTFVPNVGTAMSQAAFGFPLKPQDQVVTVDQEYASNFYPWQEACRQSGATLVVVETGKPDSEEFSSGAMITQKILDAIVPGVKIVGVSWVQFQTGAMVDLRAIGEKAHSVGAYLVVDAIQGLGQLPFSLRDLPVDFVAGGSHKWMCSMIGLGFFAGKPEFLNLLKPIVVGCATFNRFGSSADPKAAMESTARKFEPGVPSFPHLFALDSAIRVLNRVGLDGIGNEIFRLSQILRRGILEACEGVVPGFRLASPVDQRNGITSFLLPAGLDAKLVQQCKEAGMVIIQRNEFVRVSLHAFCTEEEVDRFLDLLRITLMENGFEKGR
jgi:cysteine desulfurase/selenocysteine lyase